MLIEKAVKDYEVKLRYMYGSCISMFYLCVTELNMLKEEMDDYIRYKGQMKGEIKKLSRLVDSSMDGVVYHYKKVVNERAGDVQIEDPVQQIEKFDSKIRELFNMERITKVCWRRHILAMLSICDEINVVTYLIKNIGLSNNRVGYLRLYVQDLAGVARSLKRYTDCCIQMFGIDEKLDVNDRRFFLQVLAWVADGRWAEKEITDYQITETENVKKASTTRFSKKNDGK